MFPLLECFQHALFLFSSKAQFKSHYFFEAFSHYQSHLFLPPLISLSTHELFGDWHLLTCIVILMWFSPTQYFDVEREIKVHLVHQISKIRLSSKSFQPTCQIIYLEQLYWQITLYLLIKCILLLDFSKRKLFYKFRINISTCFPT